MTGADPANRVVVTAVDARSPVGLDIVASAAAIRAGITGFHEHPEFRPMPAAEESGDELASAAMDLTLSDFDESRLFGLLDSPFHKLMSASNLQRADYARGAIWFALPEPDPAVADMSLDRRFIAHFRQALGLPDACDYGGVQLGSAGVAFLLARAVQLLCSGERDFVIVAAVDSYMLEGRLAHHDAQWRIKSPRNPSGHVPGEGAGVLLVETAARAQARQVQALLCIDGVGTGAEPNPVTGRKSSTGAGLCDAIAGACEASGRTRFKWLYSDMNGEAYKAYEWGLVRVRLSERFSPEAALMHTADTIGETGAATTAIQLGCIGQAFARGYALDEHALVLASNDEGRRGALCVSAPGGGAAQSTNGG